MLYTTCVLPGLLLADDATCLQAHVQALIVEALQDQPALIFQDTAAQVVEQMTEESAQEPQLLLRPALAAQSVEAQLLVAEPTLTAALKGLPAKL
jgi:N-methylhydantoinase A/oxoprolinase/acetone carboxylase beta subunit